MPGDAARYRRIWGRVFARQPVHGAANAAVAVAARGYGIGSLPAVVIDGRLADCCAGRGPDEKTLTREIFGGHNTVP
jgi:hypothetical protein